MILAHVCHQSVISHTVVRLVTFDQDLNDENLKHTKSVDQSDNFTDTFVNLQRNVNIHFSSCNGCVNISTNEVGLTSFSEVSSNKVNYPKVAILHIISVSLQILL